MRMSTGIITPLPRVVASHTMNIGGYSVPHGVSLQLDRRPLSLILKIRPWLQWDTHSFTTILLYSQIPVSSSRNGGWKERISMHIWSRSQGDLECVLEQSKPIKHCQTCEAELIIFKFIRSQ